MKQYEKLDIDLSTKEGLELAMCFCPHQVDENIKCYENYHFGICHKCRADYLFSEVPTKKVKRWETYDGDFVKAAVEFEYNVKMGTTPSVECFSRWLMEEIEVEE